MLLFWVYGKIMVPVTQKSRRSPHERISITASVAARLWFQFWQDYPSNDTDYKSATLQLVTASLSLRRFNGKMQRRQTTSNSVPEAFDRPLP